MNGECDVDLDEPKENELNFAMLALRIGRASLARPDPYYHGALDNDSKGC